MYLLPTVVLAATGRLSREVSSFVTTCLNRAKVLWQIEVSVLDTLSQTRYIWYSLIYSYVWEQVREDYDPARRAQSELSKRTKCHESGRTSIAFRCSDCQVPRFVGKIRTCFHRFATKCIIPGDSMKWYFFSTPSEGPFRAVTRYNRVSRLLNLPNITNLTK